MVAIVAGAGFGLERSSALVLGGAGQLGRAVLGRGGESVYVNAANGNLVVQNTDEMLFGFGPDSALGRTHNSLTASGSTWQYNVSRRVTGLSGTVNQAGSTIKRMSWDGSDVTYTYDAVRGAYVGKEGAGGYDTLSFAGSTWTWTDGASRVVELYDAANDGRIASSSDADGNALTFTYTSGLLTRVETKDGGRTELNYTGGKLTSLVTHYTEAGVAKSLTRVRYGYDTQGRLNTVTVDLTPEDGSIADGKVYLTTYEYDGTSERVAAISQSDGSRLEIVYSQVGGTYRVTRLTERAGSGGGADRVTIIAYNTATRVTTVTNPSGQSTGMAYDAVGQLISITAPPPVAGGAAQVTQFAYNAAGDVTEVTAPDGSKITYTYDAAGNRILEVDAAGVTIKRTFGSKNELLTETRYLTPAQGSVAASDPVTTRYVYDAENHLRFVVGAEGDVVEYRYNAPGQQVGVIQYTTSLYNISALAAEAAITESALNTWVSALANRSATKRTDTTYDYRGSVATVTSYSKVLADGTGDTASDLSRTVYIYDQAGRLLSRLPSTASSAEVYVYDGLGRVVSTTDFAQRQTSIAFNDAAGSTELTMVDGVRKTSTYNRFGELISYAEAHASLSVATTSYKYDGLGRLRVVTDPTGRSVHSLFDNGGRKIAEIAPDGAITEFKYDANGRVSATVAYARKLTGVQLTSLVDGSGNPASIALASVRPLADAADRWAWRIYDSAGRLIEAIDGSGAATVYTYDGSSRLVSKTSYARNLDAATLVGFKLAPPTSLKLPEGASTSTNTAPTTGADAIATVQDRPVIFDPRTNDADADGDRLTILSVGAPAHGVVLINNGVSLTYTPAAGYVGSDSFSYTVSDGKGGVATGSVTVAVAASGTTNRAPSAVDDVMAAIAGRPVIFDPRTNDTDLDGDAPFIAAVGTPAHGTVAINNGVSLTYIPAAGYAGPDSFTYTISDGHGGTAIATVRFQVSPDPALLNQAPVGVSASLAVRSGQPIVFDPRVGATDPDGDPLLVSAVGTPAHGTAALVGATGIVYTAVAGYTGSDSFTCTLSDGKGGLTTITVMVTVSEGPRVNTAPAAQADTIVVPPGRPLVFDPRINDSDVDQDLLTILAVGTPSHGSVAINNGVSLTYTPAAGYVGSDSFTYTVSDGRGGTTTATITLNVAAVGNQAPVGVNANLTVRGGQTIVFDPRLEAIDPDGDPLLVSAVGTPAHGTAVVLAGTGVSYTPTAGYTGSDSFTCTLSDGKGGLTTVTIAVMVSEGPRVNTAPSAQADTITVPAGRSLVFDPRINDSDVDQDLLTILAVGTPSHGSVAINNGVSLTYTPAAGYTGADSFTYTISDGRGGTSTATITLNVAAIANQAPVGVNANLAVRGGQTIIFDPRLGAIDPDDDLLLVTAVGTPAHGTAVLLAGTGVSYTPTAGYVGSDSFTCILSDGKGGLTTVTIMVTVSEGPRINTAPSAQADTITVGAGRPLVFDPRINDSDADQDLLTITAVGAPAHGAVTINGGVSLTYTPAAGYTGPDSFTYTVSDGRGGTTTATVTLNVASNQAPVAETEQIFVAQGSSVVFDPRLNAIDLDGDMLTIATVTALFGTVVIVGGTGIKYTPRPTSNLGQDFITYTLSDGRGGTATGYTIVRTYRPLDNRQPVAVDDVLSTVQGQPLIFDPRLNDSDADGDPLVVSGLDQPLHGSAEIVGGVIVYTPAPGYVGYDSFDYELSDGMGPRTAATVSINVVAPSASANRMGFYQPAFRVMESNLTGASVGGTSFDIPSASGLSALTSTPPGLSFSYEIDVASMAASSGIIGIASQAWFDAGGNRNTPTPGAAHWRIGSSTASYSGSSSGTTVAWVDAGRVLAAGDVIGMTYSASTRVARFYVNGSLIGTLTVSSALAGAQMYPMLMGQSSQMAGGYRSSQSSFFSSYVMDGVAPNAAPTTTNDTVTVSRGTSAIFDPRANDTDADGDGDVLTITAVGNPAHGTVTINSGVSVTYTPAAGYTGSDSFSYTVSDGKGGTTSATVSVTVVDRALNRAPVAGLDAIVTQGRPILFDPRVNDSDPNSDPLTITAVGSPAHGTVAINNGVSLTYTPAAGYAGADSFTYTISDGRGGSVTGTINVSVIASTANRAPTMLGDSIFVAQRTSVIFDPRINDFDLDGDLPVITAVGTAAHGTVAIIGGTAISYTPTAGYVGSDVFTYTVSDGKGGTATARVYVNVTNPVRNAAPVAAPDTLNAIKDGVLVFDPRINDLDPDGDLLTVAAVDAPLHGTTVIVGGVIVYTPTAGYVGPDSFIYTLSDGYGGTSTATVSIDVVAPLAPSNPMGFYQPTVRVQTAGQLGVSVGSSTFDIPWSPWNSALMSTPPGKTFSYEIDVTQIDKDSGFIGVATQAWFNAGGTHDVATGGSGHWFVGNSGAFGEQSGTTGIWANGARALNSGDVLGVTYSESTRTARFYVNGTLIGTLVLNASVAGAQLYPMLGGWAGRIAGSFRASASNFASGYVIDGTSVNSAPTTTNDTVTVSQGTSAIFDPRANDTDADGDALTITAVGNPAHGMLTLNRGVSVTYTPVAGYTGPDSFTYTVSDGKGGTKTATVVIDVVDPALNRSPVAGVDAIVTQGRPILFDPRVNDSDPNGDPLTITAVGSPAHGTVAINNGVSLTYTPAAGYAGADSFTYTISDGRGGSVTGTVNVTVTIAPNQAPTTVDDAVVVAQRTTVVFDPRINDLDPDGDLLAITAVGSAAHGTVSIVGGTGISYTPTVGYVGPDSFTYTVSDGRGGTKTATVTVTVTNPVRNAAPVAAPDTLTAIKGGALVFDPRVNDVDPEGDALTVTSVGVPAHGTASIVNGVIVYTPSVGYVGTDSFTYAVSDAYGASHTASVTVNVVAPAAPANPVGFYQPSVRVKEEGLAGVVVGASSFDIPWSPWNSALMSTPPGKTFSYEIDIVQADKDSGFIGVASQAWLNSGGDQNIGTPGTAQWFIGNNHSFGSSSGTTATWADATRALNAGDVFGVTYSETTRVARFYVNGALIGSLTMSASLAGSQVYPVLGGWGGRMAGNFRANASSFASGYVTDGLSVNSAPTAANDTVTVSQGTSAIFDPRANDTDADGDVLTITAVGNPAHGTLTLNSGVSVTYTPTAGYSGSDSFTYTVSDGKGGTKTATVIINVVDPTLNRAPVAGLDAIVTQGRPILFDPRLNDSDPNGDPLTITAVGAPAHGTVAINNGVSLTYTPAAGYAGADSFTYTISDGRGGAVTETVNVTVIALGANKAPTAVDDAIVVAQRTSLIFDPRINDNDPDGDLLAVTAVGTAAHGTVVLLGATGISYTPIAGYVGPDSFTYTVSDGRGGTKTATVTVTVTNPVRNAAPVATADVLTTVTGKPLIFDPRVNDSDADNDLLSVVAVGTPVYGSATINNGTIVYVPAAGFEGVDNFLYTISDGNGGTSTATATINVVAVQPVLANPLGFYQPTVRVKEVDLGGVTVGATTFDIPHAPWTSPWNSALMSTPPAQSFSYEVNVTEFAFESGFIGVASQAWFDAGADQNVGTPGTAQWFIGQDFGDGSAGGTTATWVDAARVPVSGDVVGVTYSAATRKARIYVNGSLIGTLTLSASLAGTQVYPVIGGWGGRMAGGYRAVASSYASTYAMDGVSNPDAPPVAVNDTITVSQQTSVVFDPRANDSVATGAQLTITAVGTAAHGAVTINNGVSLTYTPAAGYAGPDSFTYTVSDGKGGIKTATVSVTVVDPAVNRAPVSVYDSISTIQGRPVVLDPRINDIDPNGDSLTITEVGSAVRGVATINNGVSITYTPPANFVGTDTFKYTVSDGRGGSVVNWVIVTVAARPNQAPTTSDDTIVVAQRTSVTFDPRINDLDPDGDLMAISAVGAAAHGTAVLVGSTGISYTPASGYVGADSFTYTVSDGKGGTRTATVNVTVTAPSTNRGPSAIADALTAIAGKPLVFDPRTNDTDPDGDLPLITAVGTPAHGAATLSGGTIVYTATAGYTGPDSFTYTVSDGYGGTSTATVSITVAATAPTTPMTFYRPTVRVKEAGLNGATVGSSSFDISGSSWNGALMSAPPTSSFAYEVSITQAGQGSGFIGVASQAWFDAGADHNVTTPGVGQWLVSTEGTDGDVSGTTSNWINVERMLSPGDVVGITYHATSRTVRVYVNGTLIGTLVVSPALAGVQMYPMIGGWAGRFAGSFRAQPSSYASNYVGYGATPVNVAPAAGQDILTVAQGTSVVFDPRINDTDDNGDALTISAVYRGRGTVSINNGVSLTYTPAPGFVGTDTFGYEVSDGKGGTKIGSILVNVVDPLANRGPAPVADVLATRQGEALVFDPRVNDLDPDGDLLTISAVGTPKNGTAVVHGGTAIGYTPAPDFVGVDTFTYTVSDGRGGTTTASITITVAAADLPAYADRVVRNFYDRNDRLIGVLDGEGYLTQTRYDGAGQVIETIGYATASAVGLRALGTFTALLASVGQSPRDVHNWSLYDGRGLLTATINGEGDLTRYHYTAAGDVDQVVRGQRLDVASLLATAPTLAGLPSAPAPTVLETVAYERDAFGLVQKEKRTLTGGVIETTQYVYDNMRRLVSRTVALGTADARVFNQRYDARGRLTGVLSGEGSAALAALGATPTAAQVVAIYDTYGSAFTYDDADRLIARKDANGVTASGDRTLYYYDENGRLTYTINALGEVRQSVYNSFGELADSIVYGARIAAAALAALTGGTVTSALTGAISANAAVDSRLHLDYDVVGRVNRRIDAMSSTSIFAYNAFGDLISLITPIASGVQVEETRGYDRRGLLARQVLDAASGGLKLTSAFGYDAFGRQIQAIDPAGQIVATGYDRAGRVILSRDATNQETRFEYDGRGSVVKRTDRTGAVTTYSYKAFDRELTVTTPEGVTTITTLNAHGQTIKLRDGAGRETTWTYDKDGLVKSVTDGAGNQVQSAYDKAGRLVLVTDARGSRATYTYDAADRVLTRKVDDGGLNLVTSYTYDAKGQAIEIADPAGTVSKVEFDLNGRETKVVTDAGIGRLNLAVTYAYDEAGRVVTRTEGAGTSEALATRFTYDKLGRLTGSQIDPSGLNLTTGYAYDAAGNVVAKTDAAGAVSRYVYDAEGRQIFAIDPTGSVTATTYDAEGRVTRTRTYANQLASNLTGAGLSAGQVTAGVSTSSNDQVTAFVYDRDGRLGYQVGADQRVVEYAYDGSGNVLHVTKYANTIGSSNAYTMASVAGGLSASANDRTTRMVYDGANRAVFSTDAAGGVTQYAYDGGGNVVKSVRYGQAYSPSTDQSLSAMVSWAAGLSASVERRTDRTLYDGAGRAVFAVDALNYVTEQQYDAAGRVTKVIRHAGQYTVADAATAASVRAQIGGPSGTAATTSYVYDTAGRLFSTSDALGTVTRLVLDALGRVIDNMQAFGTGDVSTTRNAYDKAGRLLSRTLGYGASEASTTSYTYDGVGRVRTITDGEGYVTEQRYDAAGRLERVYRPIGASQQALTLYQYDAFGNVAAITDPRGFTGYFYYDKLNRQVLQIDAQGYATSSTYSLGGQVASITRHSNPTSGASLNAPPPVATGGRDATTQFTHDKLDRLVRVQDAEGYAETYELNAFGDQVAVTNKLGARKTRTFDALGRMLSETWPGTPETSGGASIVNRFEYDARGNVTRQVEADGLTEKRTTSFTYDLANRLLTKTGDVRRALTGVSTWINFSPVETNRYDKLGNLIEFVDSAGARTLYFYDDLGRRIAQVDALGGLSTWTYDDNGNVTAMRVYGDLVGLPASAGGSPPAPLNASNYRQTRHEYDRSNRLIATSVDGLRIGSFEGSSFVTTVASTTTRKVYDAAGNVVQEIDGRGASIYHYYDRNGREVARVDQAGYLTTYTLDAEGNAVSEERYSRRLSGSYGASSDPAALRASVAGASDDRITSFSYDRNGKRLSETRRNVGGWVVDGNGSVAASGVDATIRYSYNGLGQVTSKTEATGDQTTFAYDRLGRLTAETGPVFPNLNGWPRQRQTLNYYDALGNLTKTWEGAAGISSPLTDRVTEYRYSGGLLYTIKDALGWERWLDYDMAGRVGRVMWNRQTSTGASATEATYYEFDLLGRGVIESKATYTGAGGVLSDPKRLRYDAYGAVVAEGVAPNASDPLRVTYDYDAGGRLWRTNAGDGTTKLFVYDANGALTLTISSAGADLRNFANIDQAIAALTSNGTKAIGEVAVDGVVVTIKVLDARGQLVETREPQRQLTADGALSLVSHKKAYNGFGEVTLETNAVGGQIQYTYTALGKLSTKQQLGISYLDRWGVAGATPAETYYYDLSGRLVAFTDPRGATTTRQLIAGTGYGGEEALISREFYLDEASSKSYGYDVFGNLRTITDELGRKEERSYDRLGRIEYQVSPERADGQKMVSKFSYDGLGQRIGQEYYWNFTSHGLVATTDYDVQGRVIKTVDFGGEWRQYFYTWDASLGSEGLGVTGGWIITDRTTKGDNVAHQDYFGRTLKKIEVGGLTSWTDPNKRTTNFGYDAAGRLYAEWSTFAKNLNYAYFNSGRVKTITDHAYSALTTFGYDAEGNQTVERFQNAQGVQKNASSTYDAHGRRLTYHDDGGPDGRSVDISYAYTATNDVRRVTATYYEAGGFSPITRTSWFDYDRRNRLVVSNGELTSQGVMRGESGTAITYDRAGQRATSSTKVNVGGWLVDRTERYSYTADGYLSQVDISENGGGFVKRAEDVRDILGRVTQHLEYDGGGSNVYSRTTTYDDRSRIVSETSYNRNANGSIAGAVAGYAYNSSHGYLERIVTQNYLNGGYQSQTITDYSYLLWSDVQQVKIQSTNTGGPGAITQFVYDVNGKVVQVSINDTRSRTISLINDGTGQTISRTETLSADSSQVQDRYYVFGGVRMGQVGNNGPVDVDYASAINSRSAYPATGSLTSRPFADFAQNYDPINPSSPGEAQSSSRYTVQDGDTLRTVARNLWGDEALWYVLAEANALSGAEVLATGAVLVVPNQVVNTHHKSSTFRVFDPGDVLGQVQPNAPNPAAANKKKGCGGLGQILMVIVAVAVTALIAGPAAGAVAQFLSGGGTVVAGSSAAVAGGVIGGAAAGVAGSVASQAVGLATGVQDRFSWKGVALAAIAGGVGGGLQGGASFSSNSIIDAAARSAAGNAISQGVSVATGLQDRFSWSSVAIAGIAGGVASRASGYLAAKGSIAGFNLAAGSNANVALSGTAGAIAGAATRSLISGTNFGDNVLAALPSVIGMTVGNAIGQVQQAQAASARAKGDQMLADIRQTLAGAQDAIDNIGLVGAPSFRNNLSSSVTGTTTGAYVGSSGGLGGGSGARAPIWDGYTKGGQRLTLNSEADTSLGLAYSGTFDGRAGNFLKQGDDYLLLDRPGAADGSVDEFVVTASRRRAQPFGMYASDSNRGASRSQSAAPMAGNVGVAAGGALLNRAYRATFGPGSIYDSVLVRPTYSALHAFAETPLADPGVMLSIEQASPATAVPGAIGYGLARGVQALNRLAIGVREASAAEGTLVDLSRVGDLAPGFYRANPSQLRFSQSTVSPNFGSGGTIDDLIGDLNRGLSPDQVRGGPLQIVMRDGVPFSMDNRRLVAFNGAGVNNIPIQVVSLRDPAIALRFADRFDPIAGQGRYTVVVPNSGKTAAQQLLYDNSLIRRAP